MSGRMLRWLGMLGVVLAGVGAGGCGSSKSGDDDSGDAQSGQGGGAGTGGTGTGGTGTGGSSGKGGTGAGGGGTAGASANGGGGTTSNDYVSELRQTGTTKVDLLFMIDNSLSMASKQKLLAESIPVLVDRLIRPRCVDASGNALGTSASADGTCTQGVPEFAPARDMHVGIITSSLGDHGSGDVCSDAQNAATVAAGGVAQQSNDLAELLPSVRTGLTSWNDSGFLVWDPRDQATVSDPHANLGATETNPAEFISALATEAEAAGERGCGYESSLEAWYRFLVDPDPIDSVTRSDSLVDQRGLTNPVVLAQRAAFLRNDSLLAIVMMSDENDCSINDEDGSQGWVVGYKGGVGAASPYHLPRASAACSVSPNDACCRGCTSPAKAGCPDDATDAACSLGLSLTASEDSMNLRCFHQVQRFGANLLYPTSRYVEALTSPTITPRRGGTAVQNPLFAPGPTGVPRAHDDVILAGIIGVPWQDISSEESWSGSGLEYLSASELAAQGRWDVILGDATTPPQDPLMLESVEPRPTGAPHPLLPNAAIVAATATSNTNPINGHEQQVLSALPDDLQFACIFPLPTPIACNSLNSSSCDCAASTYEKNSPLCSGVSAGTDGSQVYGKAYPGLRELEVLKGVGANAVVASICAKSTTSDNPALDPAYGYNPAVSALMARVSASLVPKCLPRSLPVSPVDEGRVTCSILEAKPGECDCSGTGRAEPKAAAADAVRTRLKQAGTCDAAGTAACDDLCLCELPQLSGGALADCQSEPAAGMTTGFCYIDAEQAIGAESLVAACPATQKRIIRFTGDGVPASGSSVFIDCGGQ